MSILTSIEQKVAGCLLVDPLSAELTMSAPRFSRHEVEDEKESSDDEPIGEKDE